MPPLATTRASTRLTCRTVPIHCQHVLKPSPHAALSLPLLLMPPPHASHATPLPSTDDASTLPIVSTVSPTFADGLKPSQLRVFGSNFAPLSSTMSCAFGADGASPATFISTLELSCASPLSEGTRTHKSDLRVSLDGRLFSASGEASVVLTNSHEPPHMSKLSPALGPVAGGLELTIFGSGFTPSAAGLACAFGLEAGGTSTPATFATPERVTCKAPVSSAPGATVSLSVRSASAAAGGPPASTGLPFFYYDPSVAPVVSAIAPILGDMRTPPIVTLSGTGFAPVGASLQCRLGESHAHASFISGTSIKCEAPSTAKLPRGELPVRASIDGGVTLLPSRASLLLYDASELPYVSSILPPYASLGGGTSLTVSGSNFAPTPELACVFDELGLTPATLIDASTLTCASPVARSPVRTAMSVTLDQLTLSAAGLTFDLHDADMPSTLEEVWPNTVTLHGGVPLTFIGHNFNPADDVAACVFSLPSPLAPTLAPPLAAAATANGTDDDDDDDDDDDHDDDDDDDEKPRWATPATLEAGALMRCMSPKVDAKYQGTLRVHIWSASSASSAKVEDSNPLRALVSPLGAAKQAVRDLDRGLLSGADASLSATWVPLVVFEPGVPPTLAALVPNYSKLAPYGNPAAVVLVGANFATSHGGLLCEIAALGAQQPAQRLAPAIFYNGSAIQCLVPPPARDGSTGDVSLRASSDGGVSWSAPLNFTW